MFIELWSIFFLRVVDGKEVNIMKNNEQGFV